MRYIFIIIKNEKLIYFESKEISKYFLLEGEKYILKEDWIGGHYSFNVFYEENIIYLESIEADFSSNNENLLFYIRKNKSLTLLKKDNDFIFYNIKLINTNKQIISLRQFSMLFGEDYLYQHETADKLCFVFELPPEIKLLR